ncbi:hypothetical protein [Cellulosimicrobium sp. Marseille-Q4280]|uniref:hypothetical protein n=1 Tax=Cellulosimicrobium sp. Marseille-Q4280 TaxID=2937992 RepID=UPI00203AB09F|nr:hypothetical protein [Cellulosimicrobium sp. Marseille-Q4280]
MSTSTNPSRVPAGVTTGGQFSTSARGESGASLGTGRQRDHRLDVHAKVAVPSPLDAPPPFPASLGEPTLSYARDPETNQVTLTVYTEHTDEVSFWDDGHTFDHGLYQGEEVSTSQRDALIAYGKALRTNLDAAAFIVEDRIKPEIEDEVITVALGGDPSAERNAYKDSGHNVEVGAQRAAGVLRAWADEVEKEPQTAVKDALTDLIHYARSRGLDPHDVFDRAVEQAEVERDEDGDHRAYEMEANEV